MDTESLFKELIGKISTSRLNRRSRSEITQRLRELYRAELAQAPNIAIIGRTGVGKSSTINALFGTQLPVSDTVAETKEPVEISVDGQEISGGKGSLILYDMPGIGEDIDTDQKYTSMYRDVIAKCDVAIWVVSAAERDIAYDQMIIRDVVTPANRELASRLVIGVNKSDLIEPNDWDVKANLPSVYQQNNLLVRLRDVREKFTKVCPGLTSERIIGFSAKKRYRLQQLFGAMLDACPSGRAWVLSSRQDIANFLDLVDPKLRQEVLAKSRG